MGCIVSKNPCKHLHNLLPRLDDGKLSLNTAQGYFDHYGETMTPEALSNYGDEVQRLDSLLEKHGLDIAEREIVLDFYIDNLSVNEIAAKFQATTYVITDIITKSSAKIKSFYKKGMLDE